MRSKKIMEDENSVIYGLEFQARALAAQTAETDIIRFLVGTQSLQMGVNQIHLVELEEEHNHLYTRVYPHPIGEIWAIASSPYDKNIIATVYNTLSDDNTLSMKTSLWRLPESPRPDDASTPDPDDESRTNPTLCSAVQELCKFDTQPYGTDVRITTFHPSDETQVMTVVDNNFLLWDIGESSSKLVSKGSLDGKGQPRFMTGHWNLHHKCSQFVTANDSHIRGWDLRSDNQQAWIIEGAHQQLVRDFDINPNRPYFLASCGDDGRTKFWDVRNPSEPIVTRSDHSHWVWSVRYNHFHDELVVSSSSDARLVLISVASISSEPEGHLGAAEDEEGSRSRLADGVLATYDQHEDSVYGVEWCSADPWTFASLSYDGRLVINRVPKSVKYKIIF